MKAFASRRIISVLDTPKSRLELLQLTKIPERTLRHNLRILKRKNKIREVLVLDDLRTKMFALV